MVRERARFGGGGGGLTPIMFFSRRIGLDSSIRGGGRVTGRAGKFTMGVLNIQTGENLDDLDDPVRGTNFFIVRLRRDILRRSNIGIIGTSRSVGLDGTGSSQTAGADGNFSFFQNLNINTYYAETRNPGSSGRDASYRARMQNNGDRYGMTFEHLTVEQDFNPEIGFMRRDNFRRNVGQLRFSPRPRSIRAIRKFTFQGELNYITNASSGQLETRELDGQFQIEFESSNRFFFNVTDTFEFLPEEFEISDGVILPTGGYTFRETRATYFVGRQRKINGRFAVGTGSFFSGDRTWLRYGGRIEFSPQFAIEPNIQLNFVDLPQGSFTTRLVSTRVTYTLTPAQLRWCAAAVQLVGRLDFDEHPLPVGIRAGERPLHRLLGRPCDRPPWVSDAREPRLRREVHEAAAVLTAGSESPAILEHLDAAGRLGCRGAREFVGPRVHDGAQHVGRHARQRHIVPWREADDTAGALHGLGPQEHRGGSLQTGRRLRRQRLKIVVEGEGAVVRRVLGPPARWLPGQR